MAKVRLTKKGIIVTVILLLTVGLGAVGFILWRINQEATVAPTDSAAGETCVWGNGMPDGCNEDGTWGNLSDGWPCPADNCYCSNGSVWRDAEDWECSGGSGTQCYTGSDCPACDYPEVSYCVCSGDTNVTPDENGCSCVDKNYNFPCGAQCESTPNCLETNCSDYGMEDCNGAQDCEVMETCEGMCEGCNNRYTMELECRAIDADIICWDSCTTVGELCSDGTTCQETGGVLRCVNPQCPTDTDCVCDVNSCGDGANPAGSITSPAPNTEYERGQTLTINGNATDKDGIQNVQLFIDGTLVGSCTVGGTAPSMTFQCTWQVSSNITFGNHTARVTWEDGTGLADPVACSAQVVFIIEEDVADWQIAKSSSFVCINPNTPEVAARIDYVITVTYNNSNPDINGTLQRVVDRPQGVHVSWVSNINPTFGVMTPASGDVPLDNITWTLSGSDALFTPGQSKQYTYSVTVLPANFGTFNNTAYAYYSTNEYVEVNNSILVGCDIPDTGIMDSVAVKIALGTLLISLSFVYFSYQGVEKGIFKSYKFIRGMVNEEDKINIARTRFEKKVTKKRK